MNKIIILVFLLFISFNLVYSELKPGKVEVKWTTKTISVCPPGIFGKEACEFFDLVELIAVIWRFLLDISPIILTILIIIGGFYFLLIWLKPDYRNIGWQYIREAIIGYIVLLIISGVFTFIKSIIGGP